MPSFAWSSRFREGQWRAFRKFMLEERRDASSRFMVIDAELRRIGEVRVLFERDVDGRVTEKRGGISIEPADSTLGKLFQAYSALGGNPLDISMFMSPERAVSVSDEEIIETMPNGGVLYGQNIRYSYDQGVQDGDASLLKFKASRSGGGKFAAKENDIVVFIERGRKWISQEIYQKRTRLEELIIKMMDLREQLGEEVEDMIWATRGDMQADELFDPDRYSDSLTAASIAYFFDSTFRVPDPADPTSIPVDDSAGVGEAGSRNTSALAGYESLVTDEDEEENSAL
jgi:hypothetical protein